MKMTERQRRAVQTCAWAGGLVAATLLPAHVQAQGAYRQPAPEIVTLVDAPPTPDVRVSPDQRTLLLLERRSLPSIAELAQPELRLAGLRINPQTNGRSRAGRRQRRYAGLGLVSIADGSRTPVAGLPADAPIEHPAFAPDGRHVSFTLIREDRLELWVTDLAGSARRLGAQRLNGVFGAPCTWATDSTGLFCRLVPEDHEALPKKPAVPRGPHVEQTLGRRAAARTYQDLLKSSHDERLFEHYGMAAVAFVGLDGSSRLFDSWGLFRRIEPSPDGHWLLVEVVHHPFSRLVPVHRFPYRIEVWDRAGRSITQVADRPLAEDVPITRGSVPTGPRRFGWRSDVPATLFWVEAQDGGDSGRTAEVRDALFQLGAPFKGTPRRLLSLGLRFSSVQWSSDELALVKATHWKTRRTRTWWVRPGQAGSKPVLLFDHSTEDRYNDPGTPLTTTTASGHPVLWTTDKGDALYLRGKGASAEGDRPFVDRYQLSQRRAERLWRSVAPAYEWPEQMLDPEQQVMLTRRESKVEPPNYFVRELSANRLRRLTDRPHPTPQLRDVTKELIRYRRDDGVQLSGTLYLPPGKSAADGPFPVLMWAYPREYKSAQAAGQVRKSPHEFLRINPRSSLIYLAAGFAVFDDPIMPIVGEGEEEPNDTYVKQLVAGARAAVDVLVQRGVAERGRIAIGGHSYGAFMVANLLAHSDLFAAGVARSGAYNRSLTPFGFQAEQRTFWQAPEVYFRMSPFMHAEKVNEPILLIHGEADNNSGTFPLQSRRFYHALKGHGATARLVMLPHESHGYQARESVLHMLQETIAWLERYLKAEPRKP